MLDGGAPTDPAIPDCIAIPDWDVMPGCDVIPACVVIPDGESDLAGAANGLRAGRRCTATGCMGFIPALMLLPGCAEGADGSPSCGAACPSSVGRAAEADW